MVTLCSISNDFLYNRNVPANSYVLTNNALYKQNDDQTEIKSFQGYFTGNSSADKLLVKVDGEVTGISAIHNSQFIIHNEYYDLQGRRVTNPQKGLYIVNGVKVAK